MSYFSAQIINFFYLNFQSSYSQLLLNKVKWGKTIQLRKLAKYRDNIQGFGVNDWDSRFELLGKCIVIGHTHYNSYIFWVQITSGWVNSFLAERLIVPSYSILWDTVLLQDNPQVLNRSVLLNKFFIFTLLKILALYIDLCFLISHRVGFLEAA